MRAILLVGLLAFSCPVAALAQAPNAAAPTAPGAAPAPPAAPQRGAKGGDITRDDYVEHAKRLAGARFDRMDTDHDGILTAEERNAWRDAHGRHRAAAPKPQ